MEIIHISAECYPVAKAGGLGDVVGALPKYQANAGHYSKVVMPMYETKFLHQNEFVEDFKGNIFLGNWQLPYTVIKEKNNTLGFDLYLVDIKGLLDRTGIYNYDDDTERFMAFQLAVLDWMHHWQHNADIVHCHDHHTALIPFMMQHCYSIKNKLSSIPTVLTIHNAQYQGWMSWNKNHYLPQYDTWKAGLLEWNNLINPLACGVKCAWQVTTVSHSYMQELTWNSNGLEKLFEYEKGKCIGILNGIDTEVWNPKTDSFLTHHYNAKSVVVGKQRAKEELCKTYQLDAQKPLFVFIGRLVGEKAADILPDAIMSILYSLPKSASFLILGSGEPEVEWQLKELNKSFEGNYHAVIGYNEALSHQMYAGADFLLMPSRVEPCGLNQMYAMRYGTIPMVRSTGGLQDTVIDIGEENGYGLRFNHATVGDVHNSILRAIKVFEDVKKILEMRRFCMQINNSWENAVDNYLNLYEQLKIEKP
ncbi:MAG TPA: glycogen/starch synthase [Chitinophagaceae bacterium]|nr:glycogen/starch synthase [Chitinophagaceae bacterium]HNM34828.1 glycogen/starch synthase [Chitinophagaceae bacterium]HNN31196.1 glycogen/starch synthase [Chitinophagaceae bacterium]